MRQVTLREFLKPEQISEVERIVRAAPKNRVVRELSRYLKTFEKELGEKGILPEYLAWVIYAKTEGII